MKNNIDGVLVVEGSSDACFLFSIVNALIFVTNGYDLSEDKITFLKEVSKINKIIVLTDPDEAGENIRNKLKEKISGICCVNIKKESRKHYKKTGIAESKIENVLEALSPYFTNEEINNTNYDLSTLISLSDNPKETKNKIIKKYKLINGNNKFIENQLRMLKINKEDLWK